MGLFRYNPKALIAFLLTIFFIVTAFRLPITLSFSLLFLSVCFTTIADVIFTYLRRKTFFIPYAAVVTGLIIALIVDPSASWIQIFVISVLAMGIKNFLRVSQRHIFNPAASGLLMGWVIFGLHPSWWAASLSNGLIFISVAALGFVSCYRLKRYNTVLGFLLSFTILSLIFFPQFSITSFFATVLSPGTLFYTLVMVAEPMTSPVNKKRQIFYGVTVACINILLTVVVQRNIFGVSDNFPDSSLVALLIGNAVFFKFR